MDHVSRQRSRLLGEDLLQSHKLEVIGRYAASITHDFNNLLGLILGYIEIAEAEIESYAVVGRHIENIRRVAESAAKLNGQLLAYTRTQSLIPDTISISESIADYECLLRRFIGEKNTIELRLSPAAGQVLIVPGQLEQILINLTINAKDAMPDGGAFILETSFATIDGEPNRRQGGIPNGSYALLTARDTGIGMDQKLQNRVFEPFFSTKSADKGTGLGLTICRDLVRRCGGHITLESAPGIGSTFRIYLPAYRCRSNQLAGSNDYAASMLSPYDSDSRVPHSQASRSEMRSAIEYIHKNLGSSLTLPEIAGAVGVSTNYFAGLFKLATGRSPRQYVILQQVERAKLLLAERDKTVTEIAQEVGFYDSAHLSRHFKRIQGTTPTSYRKVLHKGFKRPVTVSEDHTNVRTLSD